MRIESLSAAAKTGYDVTFDGEIRNILGRTFIQNDRGSILRGSGAGAQTIYTNSLDLDSELGSIGTVTKPIVMVLFQIFHTGVVGVPAVQKPIHLDAEAGTDLFLDVTAIRADSQTPSNVAIQPVIGPIKRDTTRSSSSVTVANSPTRDDRQAAGRRRPARLAAGSARSSRTSTPSATSGPTARPTATAA